MKKSTLFILSFCCFIFLLSSCKKEALTKVSISNDYHKEIYFIDKDSLRQGPYVELELNGIDTISKTTYKDNKQHGPRYLFNKEGIIISEENYNMDVFHGAELTYYPSGALHTKGNFTNGVLDSMFYVYYETGELKERVTLKENVENGPFEEYYKNGQIHWKGNFIDGPHEVGILHEYDESGELIKKMDCGKYLGEYICQTIWEKGKGDIPLKLIYEN